MPVGFDAPSEIRRQDAIILAAEQQDRSPETIRGLIEQLDSYDPATRLLAILTLERLTGQTHGYDFAASEWEREHAMLAWVQWFDETVRQGKDALADDNRSDEHNE